MAFGMPRTSWSRRPLGDSVSHGICFSARETPMSHTCIECSPVQVKVAIAVSLQLSILRQHLVHRALHGVDERWRIAPLTVSISASENINCIKCAAIQVKVAIAVSHQLSVLRSVPPNGCLRIIGCSGSAQVSATTTRRCSTSHWCTTPRTGTGGPSNKVNSLRISTRSCLDSCSVGFMPPLLPFPYPRLSHFSVSSSISALFPA